MKIVKIFLNYLVLALMLSALELHAKNVTAKDITIDDANNLINKVASREHPYLFASKGDFDILKGEFEKGGTFKALVCRRVIERAEALIDKETLPFNVIGRRLLSTSRSALYRISTLSMAYRLTGEEKFLKRAEKELLAVCAYESWNPSHYLDTAEMSLAVSIGYDWIGLNLSDESKTAILNGLENKGLNQGLKPLSWKKMKSNWGQVCRTGMIASALTLARHKPQECALLLYDCIKSYPICMEMFAPNGSYPEGSGYWHYGVSYNVMGIAALEHALGSDFGLSELPGFWLTADYPNIVTGPTGLTLGYSDVGTRRSSMQCLWWFAKKLNRPDLISEFELSAWRKPCNKDYTGWLPPLELFWMDDRKDIVFEKELPDIWYSDGIVPVVVQRKGKGDESIFVGLKGGSPSANHGHMDGGNFVIDMGGVRWAHELENENYNRIEQMKTISLWSTDPTSGRWKLLRLNTFGHNVPMIDKSQQYSRGFASFINVPKDNSSEVVMDLTSLYPAAKKAIRKGLMHDKGCGYTIIDEFEGLKPGAEIRWKFNIKAKSECQGNKLILVDRNKRTDIDKTLEVLAEADNASAWAVEHAEGEKPLNSPNDGFYFAYFTVTADSRGRATIKVDFTLK
jgi:hypothetical protein